VGGMRRVTPCAMLTKPVTSASARGSTPRQGGAVTDARRRERSTFTRFASPEREIRQRVLTPSVFWRTRSEAA